MLSVISVSRPEYHSKVLKSPNLKSPNPENPSLTLVDVCEGGCGQRVVGCDRGERVGGCSRGEEHLDTEARGGGHGDTL